MKTLRETFGAVCALMLAATVGAAAAKPTGTVYTTAGGSATGEIQWRNSAKEYVVTTERGSITYPADDVERVDIAPPAQFASAVKAVQAGANLASAAKTLEDIAKDYRRLTYDVEATRWLAQAYLKQGNPVKAVSACEAVIRDDPTAAYTGQMAVQYWQALIKANKTSGLERLLEKAIASGDQAAAAEALVARGDSIMARGNSRANCEEALRDGYLRVILLYADPASDAYPAALYKGAQAFDGMGQPSRAGQLRDKLKAECPGSEWARK